MSGAVGAFNWSVAEKRRCLKVEARVLLTTGIPGVCDWAYVLLRELSDHVTGNDLSSLIRRIPVGFVFGEEVRMRLRDLRMQRVLGLQLSGSERELLVDAHKLVLAGVRPGDMRWAALEARPAGWGTPKNARERSRRQRVCDLVSACTEQGVPWNNVDARMAMRACALIGPLGWEMEAETLLTLFRERAPAPSGLTCACWLSGGQAYAMVADASDVTVAFMVFPGASGDWDATVRRVRDLVRVRDVEYAFAPAHVADLRRKYAAAAAVRQDPSVAAWANEDGAMRALARVLAGGPGVFYRLRHATGPLWHVERVRGSIIGQAILLVGGEPPVLDKTLYYDREFSETAPAYG